MFYNKPYVDEGTFVFLDGYTVDIGDVLLLRSGSVLLTVRSIILKPHGSVDHYDCIYYNPAEGNFQTISVYGDEVFLLLPPANLTQLPSVVRGEANVG